MLISASGDQSIFKSGALGLGLIFSLSGCSSLYYFYQAGRGQLKLLNRAIPVEEVLKDPRTDPDLANLLSKIPEIKAYGEAQGLKATSNYRDYVKLDEDAVVYVVTVSDPLAFKPKIFSFPLVGSFNYLGWFHAKDAREFAEQFSKEGYDVDVRGAGAYSTLGWFRDPLLSSMIPAEKGKISPEAYPELVNVFLHESVHATLYISNQSTFNEGLAMFVAGVLTERYFHSKDLLQSEAYRRYQSQEARSEKIRVRLSQAYQDLKLIYESSEEADQKRIEKEAYLTRLQAELGFRRKITNATLIQFQTYHSSEADFKLLFQKSQESVPSFLALLAQLEAKDFDHAQSDDLASVLRKAGEKLKPISH